MMLCTLDSYRELSLCANQSLSARGARKEYFIIFSSSVNIIIYWVLDKSALSHLSKSSLSMDSFLQFLIVIVFQGQVIFCAPLWCIFHFVLAYHLSSKYSSQWNCVEGLLVSQTEILLTVAVCDMRL